MVRVLSRVPVREDCAQCQAFTCPLQIPDHTVTLRLRKLSMFMTVNQLYFFEPLLFVYVNHLSLPTHSNIVPKILYVWLLKTILRVLLTIVGSLLFITGKSQGEFNNWYFGYNPAPVYGAGVTFNSGDPVAIPSGAM